MSRYLIVGTYTAEGAKGVLKEGGTGRLAAAQAAIASMVTAVRPPLSSNARAAVRMAARVRGSRARMRGRRHLSVDEQATLALLAATRNG